MRALISVFDKTGVVGFAQNLEKLGVEIISTGGTKKVLEEAGVKVIGISEITGFPECLDGRVKTLHPKVHGGLLARRDKPEHMQQLADLDIIPIDIVAINLYPFRETILKPDVTMEDAIENIDIGGPTMLRAAAKNYKDVTVVCDPADYGMVVTSLEYNGIVKGVTPAQRYYLALKVFQQTAAYDAMIAEYLRKEGGFELPDNPTFTYEKTQELRYGENPHQMAAFYKEVKPWEGALVNAQQLHGKELSFNNINDTNGALDCIREFRDKLAVVAVKHANPCGVAIGETLEEAYQKAHDCDPVSIFGGIVACNRPVDKATAEKMSKIFLEIVIAPDFDQEALDILQQKKNIRILRLPAMMEAAPDDQVDMKKVSGGLLIQSLDTEMFDAAEAPKPDQPATDGEETKSSAFGKILNDGELMVVTKTEPTAAQIKDMELAMKVVKHTKSNGIVFVKDQMTIAIGPGQTNRIWAVENGIKRCQFDMEGAVMASDAFFPFNDCVEAAAAAGIAAIIQPGGSIRDQESIDMANEKGVAMVFSGLRHFKH